MLSKTISTKKGTETDRRSSLQESIVADILKQYPRGRRLSETLEREVMKIERNDSILEKWNTSFPPRRRRQDTLSSHRFLQKWEEILTKHAGTADKNISSEEDGNDAYIEPTLVPQRLLQFGDSVVKMKKQKNRDSSTVLDFVEEPQLNLDSLVEFNNSQTISKCGNIEEPSPEKIYSTKKCSDIKELNESVIFKKNAEQSICNVTKETSMDKNEVTGTQINELISTPNEKLTHSSHVEVILDSEKIKDTSGTIEENLDAKVPNIDKRKNSSGTIVIKITLKKREDPSLHVADISEENVVIEKNCISTQEKEFGHMLEPETNKTASDDELNLPEPFLALSLESILHKDFLVQQKKSVSFEFLEEQDMDEKLTHKEKNSSYIFCNCLQCRTIRNANIFKRLPSIGRAVSLRGHRKYQRKQLGKALSLNDIQLLSIIDDVDWLAKSMSNVSSLKHVWKSDKLEKFDSKPRIVDVVLKKKD